MVCHPEPYAQLLDFVVLFFFVQKGENSKLKCLELLSELMAVERLCGAKTSCSKGLLG